MFQLIPLTRFGQNSLPSDRILWIMTPFDFALARDLEDYVAIHIKKLDALPHFDSEQRH